MLQRTVAPHFLFDEGNTLDSGEIIDLWFPYFAVGRTAKLNRKHKTIANDFQAMQMQ